MELVSNKSSESLLDREYGTYGLGRQFTPTYKPEDPTSDPQDPYKKLGPGA